MPSIKRNDGGILIVDPTGGMSGDMFLGCMFALGVDPREVEKEVAKVKGLEPFRIISGSVKRNGISVRRARVSYTAGVHDRDMRTILRMIDDSPLGVDIKDRASGVFRALGRAEGKVHGRKPEEVHFHEVGAVDSIVDIVGGVIALSRLGFPPMYHRPFILGHGMIEIAHGKLPLPAPATLELLEGRTVSLGDENAEIVTPTGAALMKVLGRELPATFRFIAKKIVYSTGSREKSPGLLRVILAEAAVPSREITVVRTTIDDMSAEKLGYVQEMLFEESALEVYFTQVIMKKGRPGVQLTVLCDADAKDRIVSLLFRETTTLGVRIGVESRDELERWSDTVKTRVGDVDVKRCRMPDGTVDTFPEYESCRAVARAMRIPIRSVYEEVASSVRSNNPDPAVGGRGRGAGGDRGKSRAGKAKAKRAHRRRGRGE